MFAILSQQASFKNTIIAIFSLTTLLRSHSPGLNHHGWQDKSIGLKN
jgi:hypothetical protein